jgi:8-oxo-dGTP diphosphatase
MQGYNVIAVFNKNKSKLLMCRRKKNPYIGLNNLVGGKIELNENGLNAAYRELLEETNISRNAINLTHLMDFTYHLSNCYVEVYVGNLKEDIKVKGDENELFWSELDVNFFDMEQFAGEGNIAHIMEQIKIRSEKIFDKSE